MPDSGAADDMEVPDAVIKVYGDGDAVVVVDNIAGEQKQSVTSQTPIPSHRLTAVQNRYPRLEPRPQHRLPRPERLIRYGSL